MRESARRIIEFVEKEIKSGIKPERIVLAGFGQGGAVALSAALRCISDGVETPLKDGEVLSASGSKWVGTGIRTFYILAFLAIGLMLVSGARKIFNK